MKGAGIVLIILALVIGIVPMFTHCELAGPTVPLQSGATTFMKCHWTARAESAVALHSQQSDCHDHQQAQ